MPSLLRPASRLAGRRIAPILIATDLVREGHRHWTTQLRADQRRQLVELAKLSHGRWSNLTPKEQREAKRLLGELDVPGFAKSAAVTAAGFKSKRGRKKK